MHNADNYSLRDYGKMISDHTRTAPFIEALKRSIVPGESTLLDIGTGFGFFTFVACKLGAKKVYAVEPDDSIDVAILCDEAQAYAGRIEWIRGLSTKISLPEKVDIVIADLHGTLPFYNSNIASMIDARERHLKPDGRIISMRDRLFAAPAFAPDEYQSVDTPWQQNQFGIDLEIGRTFVVNNWWRARPDIIPATHILSTPIQWAEIDYRNVDTQNVSGTPEWRIERGGTLHGFYIWFDGDVAEGLGYSNAPTLPELVYGRAFFPLEQSVEVEVGDNISARISANLIDGSFIYRWDTSIRDSSGHYKAQFRQSTFKARPIRTKDLQAFSTDHRPAINEDGEIAQVVLNALDQSRSIGEIAHLLTARFPQRFANEAAALKHVSGLLRKFSGDSSV